MKVAVVGQIGAAVWLLPASGMGTFVDSIIETSANVRSGGNSGTNTPWEELLPVLMLIHAMSPCPI
jgi:hypothetical protein